MMTPQDPEASPNLDALTGEYIALRETIPWNEPQAESQLSRIHAHVAKFRTPAPLPLLQLLERDHGQIRGPDGLQAREFYFSKFFPLVFPIVETKPSHVKLRGTGYTVLISMMGLSPETTIIATSIVRPAALLIIRSSGKGIKEGAGQAVDILVRNKLICNLNYRVSVVDEFNPKNIYTAIRRGLQGLAADLQLELSSVALDLTGGTKVMSAAAGMAAWQHKLDLLYLKGNKPSEGMTKLTSEYELMLLDNPSDQRGEELRRSGLEAWRRRDFNSAAASFQEAWRLLRDNAFDEISHGLSECYLAMLDFDREKLRHHLGALAVSETQHRIRALLSNQPDLLTKHTAALTKLANGEPASVGASLVVLAEIYRKRERHSLAVLLNYRFMEQLVASRLARYDGFTMRRPDYSALCKSLSMEELDRSFQGMRPKKPYPLPPDLGLVDGFILLVILEQVNTRWPNEVLDPLSAVGKLMEAAKHRNDCVWTHGARTMSAKESGELYECARNVAIALMDEAGHVEFLDRVEGLRPLDLSPFVPEFH